MKIKGSKALLEQLKLHGVQVMFGYPGGAVIPLYDSIYEEEEIRHVLVRHEQGAGHMAEGYAKVTGKVGVCIATSGPGATNLVTPLADAYMDNVPILAITGQVSTWAIGTDAFQEADITGITMSCTKHNRLVKRAEEIPEAIAEAFYIASTGRPGPVLVDIPRDLQDTLIDYRPINNVELPSYKPTYRGHPLQIVKAARAIEEAKKPVFYVGGGVVYSGGQKELVELAERTNIMVTTTLLGKGAFPETHDLSLLMLGMHGTEYANYAVHNCDLLIAVGARFDDRVTGKLDQFAPNAKVIHIDIDPAEISKNVHAHIPIVGDAKMVLGELEAREAPPGGRVDPGAAGPPHEVPALLHRRRGRAVAAVVHRGDLPLHEGRRHRRDGRRPAPDVGRPVLQVRPGAAVGHLRRAGDNGLRPSGRDRRQAGPPGQGGLARHGRRQLPDDPQGADDGGGRGRLRESRHHQQPQPGHGPPVAAVVLG